MLHTLSLRDNFMKNILVIRFSSLGDLVLTTGVIRYIKHKFSDNINIDILTMSHFAGILEDFPYIRNIYCINQGASLIELNKTISLMPEYDYIVDLHDNTRSSFVKFISSCKSFTYKKNSLARRLFVKWRVGQSFLNKHVVEKYFDAFAKCLNIPEKPSLEELRPYLVSHTEHNKQKKRVVIHPFASKKTKEWPFFNQLISSLLDDGLEVLVVGNGVLENINPSAVDLTGKISLTALKDTIAGADVFISTDSGPLHIGIALKVPVITIFGPTTKEFGFYPQFNNVKVIENYGLKCRPCHIHGSNKCRKKHFKCMLDIGAEEIRYHTNYMLKKKNYSWTDKYEK